MRFTVALLVLAADEGKITFRAMPGGQPAVLNAGKKVWFGAYVTIGKKQPDGTWRVRFDTGDDDSRRSGDA